MRIRKMMRGYKGVTVQLSAEHYDWLLADATKHKVGVATILRALVVDAMEETDGIQRSPPPRRPRSRKGSETNGASAP